MGSITTDDFLNAPPSGVLVVEALAMLFEITSVRNLSTLIPVAAILIEVNIPIFSSVKFFNKNYTDFCKTPALLFIYALLF